VLSIIRQKRRIFSRNRCELLRPRCGSSSAKPKRKMSIVAYASRQLNKAHINYSATEKELLGVVWAIKHFRHYLIGRSFSVECDHKPLQWLAKMKDTHGRLKRWSLKLLEYDFTIKYVPGKMNEAADFLSRKLENEISSVTANATETLNEISTENSINELQKEDEFITDLKHKLKDLNTKKIYRDEFEIRKYRPKNSPQTYLQTVVPKKLTETILQQYHTDPLGGHLGVAKILDKSNKNTGGPTWLTRSKIIANRAIFVIDENLPIHVRILNLIVKV